MEVFRLAKDYCVCFSSLQRLNVTPESYFVLKKACQFDKSLLRAAEAQLRAGSTNLVPMQLVLTVRLGSQT